MSSNPIDHFGEAYFLFDHVDALKAHEYASLLSKSEPSSKVS